MTLFGIRLNNQTNRAAITASDRREHFKWQRDTILRLSGEALDAAARARSELNRLSLGEIESREDFLKFLERLVEQHHRLSLRADMLSMLDAGEIGLAYNELRDLVADKEYLGLAGQLGSFDDHGHPLGDDEELSPQERQNLYNQLCTFHANFDHMVDMAIDITKAEIGRWDHSCGVPPAASWLERSSAIEIPLVTTKWGAR
ncbi:hypothetical protein [Nocardia sp. NPDC004711]